MDKIRRGHEFLGSSVQMTALPRLERNGGRLLSVESINMGGVRLDDVGSMGALHERPVGGTCSRLPVEYGGIPRLDAPTARPKEITGQKSQDWVPEPGGLVRVHPYNKSKLDRGPCENQSGGSPVDGGEDTTR